MKKFIITEEEKNKILNLYNLQNILSEASSSSLSILKNSVNKILAKPPASPSSFITLNGASSDGKAEQLKYNVKASMAGVEVPLIIKTFAMPAVGATSQNIVSDAKPDCPDGCRAIKLAMWSMRKGQDDKLESPYEGYNRFYIPLPKFNSALQQLQKNPNSAVIDAGFGVKLTLTLSS